MAHNLAPSHALINLDPTNQLCIDSELQDVSKVFFEIEMASMPAFISMEQLGVYIDTEYAKTISEKYHKLSEKTHLFLKSFTLVILVLPNFKVKPYPNRSVPASYQRIQAFYRLKISPILQPLYHFLRYKWIFYALPYAKLSHDQIGLLFLSFFW